MARRKAAAPAEPSAQAVARPRTSGAEDGSAICTTATSAACTASVADPLHDLRFGLREQISYHGTREIFLSRLGRLLTGVQVLLGTAAVAMMADAFPDISVALVSTAALTGVLLLVLDPFAAAREHRILRSRFHELMADIEEIDTTPSAIGAIRAKMQRIMASAPPGYRAVQAIAFNMAVNATYAEEDAVRYRYKIGWVRRAFANWFAMRGMPFKRG